MRSQRTHSPAPCAAGFLPRRVREGAERGDAGTRAAVHYLCLGNVRRPGKQVCRLEPDERDAVADDFARYVHGADDEFAKRFSR